MAGTFSEQAFELKLCNLKDTQESISAMSNWCLKNKEHHKKIVTCWLHCLKRVKIDQRLSLFYLANDVIQYSKRKHLDFVDSWGTALQKATTLVRDDKVRHRIMRIFKIWEERGVYDEPFIADLCGLLTTHVKKKEPEVTDANEFQPNSLIKKVRECSLLEDNTDSRYRRVQEFKLPLTDAESMRLSLKDRRHGSDVAAEVDSGVRKMEAYVKALETEISAREKLIDMLRHAMLFYENQRGEAKIVANAYKNFGGRLRNRKKTLEELVPTLLSPLPSPDVNAPSPSPSPEPVPAQAPAPQPFNGNDLDFSFSSSFIGSQFLDLHKDVLSSEAAQSIPVIEGTRAEPPQFNVAEFLKSLLPKENPLPPPPMPPPVFGDWSGVPWEPPPETPQSPPVYEKQPVLVHQPLEYDDSLPVPPVPDVDHRSLLPLHSTVELRDVDHRHMDYMHVPPPTMDRPPPTRHMEPLVMPPPNLHTEPPPLLIEPPPVLIEPPPLLSLERGAVLTGGRNLISLTGTDNVESVDMDVSDEETSAGLSEGSRRFARNVTYPVREEQSAPVQTPVAGETQVDSLADAINSSMGAKLIPPLISQHQNGMGHFSPRPRWPYRTSSPFRGNYRPRGRW